MAPEFEAARAAFLAGLQAHEAGRYGEAEAAYRRSLALLPGRPSTLTNLGATLIKLGRAAEALPLFDAALAAEPAQADALAQRGVALGALGRPAEALACFDALLGRGADDAPTWFHHGLSLAQLGRAEEALTSYRRALQHDAQLGAAASGVAGLLKDLGRRDEAIAALRQAIALGADVEVNRYLLASLTGTEAPASPPPDYVRELFDGYAPQFEQHLVKGLQYGAPQTLAALLAGRHFDSALDLGCGTGLCGRHFAPLVRQIDGVDLSAGMLRQAAAGGRYRTLVQADIVPHLQSTAERYALVIAADVFIYIGALAPVFAGVRRVLRPRGRFAFSVEHAGDAVDWELRPSSRYAHSERHLRALALAEGFEVETLQPTTLRLDQRRPVAGLLAVMILR